MSGRKRLKRICWAVLIAAIAITSFLSLDNNSVYYYTPKELADLNPQKRSGKIRIGGMVKSGSIVRDRKNLQIDFILSDLDATELLVSYRGTPPDLFKENSGVIAEGQLSSDFSSFAASKLLVKHSEEYKRPDIHPSLESELVKKSLFSTKKGPE